MSGARRQVRDMWLGVSGVLLALTGAAWGTEISRAREVAPPPGDRGDLLYEVPIAPATPPKAPSPAVSVASSAKGVLRREARDTVPAHAAMSSRQAGKPATPGSAPTRRSDKGAGTGSADAARAGQALETAHPTKAGQKRPAVRGGREADVPRETPSAAAAQRTQVKQLAAPPSGRAIQREKAQKTGMSRDRAKAPATTQAGEALLSRQAARAQPRAPRPSGSVKAGVRQSDARASKKAIVAQRAIPPKRTPSTERVSAKPARNAPVGATARTARQSAPQAATKARAKVTPKAAQNAAKAVPKPAPKAATRLGSAKPSQPVKSQKPKPQKSPRAPSR